MPYSQENGYVALTIDEIMALFMAGVNAQFGTSYTAETFLGTNFYKYFYILAQRVQANEIKLSEIFLKLQDYFKITNETIVEPKVTFYGLINVFAENNFVASIKEPLLADAGKVNVCVDVDSGAGDYAAKKLAINTLIKDYTVAGTISQGTETSTITLTNGQSFDFSFHLPNKLNPKLRLTLTTSRNNKYLIDDTDTIKLKLLANIAAKYQLGKDFEPEIYFTASDALYASDILLEYSLDNGATWSSDVYETDFDELFNVTLANITIVQV